MNLNIRKWERFFLGRLFDIKKGKRLTSAEQEDGTNIYVGAIDSNNGVANYIGQKPIHKGNTISLSYNGSVGEAFYQPEPYWATDDVNALYSKYEGFNKYIGLFMATVIRQEKYRFSYGRKWTLDNMLTTDICLPILHNFDGTAYIDDKYTYSDNGYVPDWQFMEDYIKSLHYKPLTTNNTKKSIIKLNDVKWKRFKIGELFFVELAKGDIKFKDIDNGNIPLVSSGESDNGIVGYIDEKGDGKSEIFPGNCITVDMFCNPFYQSEPFYSVSHGRVNILIPKFKLTKKIGLFIVTIIKQEQYKYSYGRGVYSDEATNIDIVLPVDSEEKPNWRFMEKYIESLPYGDRL